VFFAPNSYEEGFKEYLKQADTLAKTSDKL